MKYLQPSFSMAVTDRHGLRKPEPKAPVTEPHAYINGGSMCQVCGMAKEAPLHMVK